MGIWLGMMYVDLDTGEKYCFSSSNTFLFLTTEVAHFSDSFSIVIQLVYNKLSEPNFLIVQSS